MQATYLDRISVRLIYKNIAEEMLSDENFAEAAEKKGLYLNDMYEKYQAARVRE